MPTTDLAAAITEYLGGRKGEVEVGRLCAAFPAYDQSSVMAALRELEGLGGGRLVLGRGGYKTRFIPSVVKTGGNGDGGATIPKAVPENSEHVFVLRREPVVRVTVPSDLTSQEAERLAAWVKALAVA
jgi:hypothetical protein